MLQEGSRFEIAYYTGTGSTAMVAECLHEALKARGCAGGIQKITEKAGKYESDKQTKPARHDLLFLLFPIHSFNAPEAVYRWIDRLDKVDKTPAVVFAVTGGGEVVTNTAGSLSSIRRLEKKGYVVTYDTILTMPNNFWVATIEPLAVKLLEVLPGKVERIVDEVLSGVICRPKRRLFDRIVSRLGESGKPFTGSFGKAIKVSQVCTGCGTCSRECPAGNITLQGGRPVFADRCHFCLNCFYICPNRALTPGKWKIAVIKEGYNLKALQAKVPLSEPVDVEKLAKGFLWSGVGKYLME